MLLFLNVKFHETFIKEPLQLYFVQCCQRFQKYEHLKKIDDMVPF